MAGRGPATGSRRGAAAGALIGLAAAWAAFGVLNGRGLGRPPARMADSLARGALAALGSGLAFYAISGIWTRPPPGGPDYLSHFLRWTLAYLPGFLALLVGRDRSAPRES